MAKTANQLTVAKSADAADTVASAIWDLVTSMDVVTARDASTQRQLRRHARELCDLHDDIDPEQVLRTPHQPQGNGSLADLPAYAGQS